ncbi:MAG: acyl carrier protein [Kofleriaceae bacterium]
MTTKPETIGELAAMITTVIGEDHFEIEATSTFKEELAFESIQFVALAELIQERWTDIDFVTWLTTKEVPELLALRVGDVADFIVAQQA